MTKLSALRLRRKSKRKKTKTKRLAPELTVRTWNSGEQEMWVIHLLYNQNERDLTRYLGVLHLKRNTYRKHSEGNFLINDEGDLSAWKLHKFCRKS